MRLNRLAVLLMSSVVAGFAQAPPMFTLTDLGTLGGSASTATAINSNGDIVGYSNISGDVATHAFLYSNGSMQDLGTLGGPNSWAYSINTGGQIVGVSEIDSSGDERAFLYSNGSMQDLGTLGGPCGALSTATSINNMGQIVGAASIGCSEVPYHAYLYTIATSTMQDLGVVSGNNSEASQITDAGFIAGGSDADSATSSHVTVWNTGGPPVDLGIVGNAVAVNSSDDIVGWGVVPGEPGEQGFLYSNGTLSGLGNPGRVAFGMGVNNRGIAVGLSNDSGTINPTPFGENSHAFLNNGTLYDLSTLLTGSPGWTMYNAYAIDDQVRIVGTGTFNGKQHAVLLTPATINPPVAHPTQSPAANGAGWNNSNVTVQWNWTDTGGPGIDPANCTTSSISSGQGVITLSATCKDLSGLTGTAQYTVMVDTTPPSISCSASPSVVWPPNGKLINITTTVNVSDGGSGSTGFVLLSVTSNEPGSGEIEGWVVGAASTSGELQAQRQGSGSGRVYTLVYQASDKAGNTATCTTTVTVPHDQGK